MRRHHQDFSQGPVQVVVDVLQDRGFNFENHHVQGDYLTSRSRDVDDQLESNQEDESSSVVSIYEGDRNNHTQATRVAMGLVNAKPSLTPEPSEEFEFHPAQHLRPLSHSRDLHHHDHSHESCRRVHSASRTITRPSSSQFQADECEVSEYSHKSHGHRDQDRRSPDPPTPVPPFDDAQQRSSQENDRDKSLKSPSLMSKLNMIIGLKERAITLKNDTTSNLIFIVSSDPNAFAVTSGGAGISTSSVNANFTREKMLQTVSTVPIVPNQVSIISVRTGFAYVSVVRQRSKGNFAVYVVNRELTAGSKWIVDSDKLKVMIGQVDSIY